MIRPMSQLVARASSGLGWLGFEDEPDSLPGHAGLWLDRIVAQTSSDASPEGAKGQAERLRLYEIAVRALRFEVAGRTTPAVLAYRHVHRAWQLWAAAEAPGVVRRTVVVEARSRLLLHPATGETVTEGSVLLHHTYGVPYLPGSGLKGVLRSRLRTMGGEELANRLLGTGGEVAARAAAFEVLDALWVPEKPPGADACWSPLALDVVTPHHPDYYTAAAGGRSLPTDYDEPTPVHRLTVAPGTRFRIVVEAAAVEGAGEWLEKVLDDVLLPALDESGFGAWTSVGYGRLRRLSDSASGSSSVPSSKQDKAPVVESFEVIVRYEAGSGELRTVLPDGRVATAGRADTGGLFARLPEAVVERLRSKKRQARLVVDVEPLGRAWRIASLRPLADN